jgi:hypothetical protein
VCRRLGGRLLPRRSARPAACGVSRPAAQAGSSLHALTVAALALPGLAPSTAQAADGDEGSFQYGHYKEGERSLFGVKSAFDPIRVDSLHGSGGVTLFDRFKFAFDYVQDTWSGATPVATAPRVLGGNRPSSPDGVSGATPLINGDLFFDSQLNPIRVDPFTNEEIGEDRQLVHTLSSASPETRKQGDFKLSYEWDEAALTLGGGTSLERDYESQWVNTSGRWDFNQKLTSLNLGLSYTASDTKALLDPDALPYINTSAFNDQIEILNATGDKLLRGERDDWATRLGVTQVLSKNSVIEASVGYTRSTGYLENPYKVTEVAFIDPAQQFLAPPGGYFANVRALLEQRPDARNQWTWDARYVQYVEGLDAALHLGYRFFHDDWGINAHTFEADWGQPVGSGWTITPRVRYYSQDAADFYRPYLVSMQAYETTIFDPDTGDITDVIPFDPKLLPAHFSSDHRLSGFGALSGGVTVSKQFGDLATIEGSFEYYTHQGELKLGGGGEGEYADFDYYQFNVGLRVNLSAAALSVADSSMGAHEHGGHHEHGDGGHGGHGHAPAGVMFDHMLPKAGEFMVGYRYMFHSQSGDTLHGSKAASDLAIIERGCGSEACRVTPDDHTMHMHMLELMYAPTDWLNLMLMPQFVDMDMTQRDLDGAPPPPPDTPPSHFTRHGTGGVGDTFMVALVKLFDVPGHHLHLGFGLSAPTGDVDVKLRRMHQEGPEFIHYGMQLGSGTWDLLPSLTYAGRMDRWSWGGQLSGIARLEDRNESGYALGDQFQANAWGSYDLTHWLSASVRGVYTTQGAISGEFNGPVGHRNRQGPMDFPANYGGRYWDVGFGLSAVVPKGDFKGNRLSVEWLQPVEDDVNGYQLERDGSLYATWSLAF